MSSTSSNQEGSDNSANKQKRKKILLWVAGGFILAGLIVFCLWLFVFRFSKYTDDAYVRGNMVDLTPQVAGIVASINVNETDFVKENQVLIELDTTNYQLQLELEEANLAKVVRNVKDLFQAVETKHFMVEAANADVLKEKLYYEKRVGLVNIGGVSREDFQTIETGFLKAEATFSAALSEEKSAIAMVEGTTIETHPMVIEAAQRVKEAFISLRRCSIVAPTSGFVTQRSVQLGESVQTGSTLLSIIPLNELWVNANYKETKLSNMRIGQPVKLTSDMYGSSVVYKGHIVGMNPGTGNAFSVLPPQNATGNWIKIVQRVPVRVSLDEDELQKNPLWIGLSMKSWVDVKDTSLPQLQKSKKLRPIYHTDVYEQQLKGAEVLVQCIIQNNS